MKFRIKKSILQEKLNEVSKALSSKNIIPILTGIKFDLTKEKLTLTASDNDITIQTYIEVDNKDFVVEKTGSIIIKGRYIIDIVRKMNSDDINIEILDGNKILIYNANSEFNLNGISSKEYPNINLDLTQDPITIKKSDFKKIINQTSYASSLDESRAILTGVNIKTSKDKLECTATDSYRLAYKSVKIENEKQIEVVVPTRNLLELLKLIDDDDANLQIHIFSNKIIFNFNTIIFQSRIISGTYPNTNNLISEEASFEILINKLDLFGMIDRASILNNDKDNNIVTLDINKNDLKITSMSLEIGKVEESYIVDCKEKIKISFNSKYMLDALKPIETENVKVLFIGEVRPIILKEEDNNDLLQLVLPIRTY